MENNKNDFYIGWQDTAPDTYANKAKKFIWVVLLIIPLVALLLVLTQEGFEDSNFEFGKLTEIEGFMVYDPTPMIKTFESDGVKSILLVGFGKMGAENDIAEFENIENIDLENKSIKLNGTLIYHNGKTVLELTEGKSAFVGTGEMEKQISPLKKEFGYVTLRGEIYDPKCAFGVMKPGYGKPHRSCAVRCISGGIPPVLKIENKKGEKNYCLLLGKNGEPINEEVLEYVADQVQICGYLEQQDDWLVLRADPVEDIIRLKPHWMEGSLAMCIE